MDAKALREEMQQCADNAANLNAAIFALQKVPDNAGVNVAALVEKRDCLQRRAKEIYPELRKAQTTCPHHWEDAGRDSHHDWRKCSLCGLSDRC